jgi:hypothetical protein
VFYAGGYEQSSEVFGLTNVFRAHFGASYGADVFRPLQRVADQVDYVFVVSGELRRRPFSQAEFFFEQRSASFGFYFKGTHLLKSYKTILRYHFASR